MRSTIAMIALCLTLTQALSCWESCSVQPYAGQELAPTQPVWPAKDVLFQSKITEPCVTLILLEPLCLLWPDSLQENFIGVETKPLLPAVEHELNDLARGRLWNA